VLKGATLMLAYVSIGEIPHNAPEKIALARDHLLLAENPVWKTSIVDLTAPIWRHMVLARVGEAEAKGFDGVMLDTLDSPLDWADHRGPQQQMAMREAAVILIEQIHTQFPHMKIMLNRGISILPQVAQVIDYALAESILSTTDISTGQSSLFPPNTYAQAVAQLHAAATFAPGLQLFTLDYWNQDDVQGLQRIYAMQRAHGFIPYVTTPDLRHYTPEPARARPERDASTNYKSLGGMPDA
jgi:uncharacterized protein (TIGR01370 family)